MDGFPNRFWVFRPACLHASVWPSMGHMGVLQTSTAPLPAPGDAQRFWRWAAGKAAQYGACPPWAHRCGWPWARRLRPPAELASCVSPSAPRHGIRAWIRSRPDDRLRADSGGDCRSASHVTSRFRDPGRPPEAAAFRIASRRHAPSGRIPTLHAGPGSGLARRRGAAGRRCLRASARQLQPDHVSVASACPGAGSWLVAACDVLAWRLVRGRG